MKKFKDLLIIGFALFAMFLGAGNLIFPPTLGAIAGKSWVSTMIGFMITGIGLPVLGIIATSKVGGKTTNLSKNLGEKPSLLFSFLIVLAIGPLLAIPRTAAVTYELAVKPLFPSISPTISALIFFLITLYFTLNASTVIDKVGSILTPILLVIISFIVFANIFSPIGVPIDTLSDKNFLRGFEEGYQTMDALASLVFANIIIQNVKDKGYTTISEQTKLTVLAGLIAAAGLIVVYGGFVYLGASGSGLFSTDLSRVDLLISLVERLLGKYGSMFLGLAVGLACLTTAIGLTATAGSFFSGFSEKLGYKFVVYLVCAFSAFFAINGVDTIIAFSVPILSILYPVAIVLIVMNLLDKYIKYKSSYKGACTGAFIISLLQNILVAEGKINIFLEKLNLNPFFANITPQRVNFDTTLEVLQSLPLAKEGFAWIIPAIILGIVFAIFERSKKSKQI